MPASPDDASPGPSAHTTQPATSPQIASFEDGLATLGDLVARLESGGLGLSESIAAYEQGVSILRQLHDELARADERVRVLVRLDDEGRPVLADHEIESSATDAADPSTVRRRPRGKTSRGRSLPGMDDETAEA